MNHDEVQFIANYIFGKKYTDIREERSVYSGTVYIQADNLWYCDIHDIRKRIDEINDYADADVRIEISTCSISRNEIISYDAEICIPLYEVHTVFLIIIGEPCLANATGATGATNKITGRSPKSMIIDDMERFFTIPGIKFHRMFQDCYNIPEIKKIYIGKKKKSTTIEWSDGTKTKVKCGFGDEYNLEAGINAAVVKKISRSTHYYYKHIKDKIVYTDKGKIMDKEDVLKVDDIPKNVEEK